jgi:short-subunit dehydrogenase
MSTQIALVTGASSGLGLECSRQLVKRSISTLMVARRANVLREKALEINAGPAGCHVYTFVADVGSPTDVQKIRQFTKEEDLHVKWLINNAGVGKFGEIGRYSYQDIEDVFRANLIGTILMSQAFLDEVVAGQGVICNVMSTAALNFRPMETVYTAAKWGARGFTETLRAELKGKPVRVMAVYPGGMNTHFWDESRQHVPDSSKFMSVEVVAERIISNIFDAEMCQVSDITINRL